MSIRCLHLLGRCFHLNPQQPIVHFRNEIEMGTVAEWDKHGRALARQPLHGRDLAQVTLLPTVHQSLHEPNIRSSPDGNRRLASRAKPLARAAQRLRLGQVLEAAQGLALDLAHALAGDAERRSGLLEGERLAATEPVAELEHEPGAR